MCSTNSTSPSLTMPDLTVNRSFWSKAEYAREFLGIALTEPLTVELLRKKFKKASLKCHPDKPDGSHKLFQTLQDYYDFLMVEATALNAIHDHSNIVVEEESEEEPVVEPAPVVEESAPATTEQDNDESMDALGEPIYEAGATDIPCYEDDDIEDVDESFEEPTVLSSKEKREALWQKKADERYHGPADPNRKFYYAITDRNRCQTKVPKRQLVLGIPVQSNLSSTASSLQRAALTVKRNQTWCCIEAVDKSKPPAVRKSSLQQEYMKVVAKQNASKVSKTLLEFREKQQEQKKEDKLEDYYNHSLADTVFSDVSFESTATESFESTAAESFVPKSDKKTKRIRPRKNLMKIARNTKEFGTKFLSLFDSKRRVCTMDD